MSLTYVGVGTSVERSAGERRARIGSGRAAFDRASAANLRWEVKTRAGFRVDHPTVELGRDYVIRLGPLVENVRVVAVIDEPRRSGFAYGTLPRHPLRGEEAFLVEWKADDGVELVVRSFSEPNGLGWALLSSVIVIARTVFIRRYLRALLD